MNYMHFRVIYITLFLIMPSFPFYSFPVERFRTQTTPIDLDKSFPVLGGGSKKDELSSSFNSVTSNSTLTEQEDINPIMKRTFTVGQEGMKRPSISRQKR